MSGLRVTAVKARLFGEASPDGAPIGGVLRDLPDLTGVQVAYSYPPDAEREAVYGDNSVEGNVTLSAMMGSGRLKRQEQSVFGLVVMATEPGQPYTAAVEARVAQLGAAVEEYIAANPTCGDVPDVKLVEIVAIELDSGVDDESATAVLTYQIRVTSYLQ